MADIVNNISQRTSQNAYKISGAAGLFAVTIGRFAFREVLALGAIMNIVSNLANNADKSTETSGVGLLYPSPRMARIINAILILGFAALVVFNPTFVIPAATAYVGLKTLARAMQHAANFSSWKDLYKDINFLDLGGVALYIATAIFSPAYILAAIVTYGIAKATPPVTAYIQAKYKARGKADSSSSLSSIAPEPFIKRAWSTFVKFAPLLIALGATALIGASSGLLALSGIVASNLPAIQGILPFITAPVVTSFAAYDYLTSDVPQKDKARSITPEPILAMNQSTLMFHGALGLMRLNPAISLLLTFGSLLYGVTKLFDPNTYKLIDKESAKSYALMNPQHVSSEEKAALSSADIPDLTSPRTFSPTNLRQLSGSKSVPAGPISTTGLPYRSIPLTVHQSDLDAAARAQARTPTHDR